MKQKSYFVAINNAVTGHTTCSSFGKVKQAVNKTKNWKLIGVNVLYNVHPKIIFQ